MRDWGYPPMIANALAKKENSGSLLKVNYPEQLLKMLDTGRLDGMIFTPATLKDQMQKESFNHEFMPIAFYEEELHFLFSKKSVSSDIVAEFNASLIKLIVEGDKQKIFEKYQSDK